MINKHCFVLQDEVEPALSTDRAVDAVEPPKKVSILKLNKSRPINPTSLSEDSFEESTQIESASQVSLMRF